MPFLLAVPYLLIEALTFWAVASWIGVGWALLALFGVMFLGAALAVGQLRRVSRLAAANRISPGRVAGDYGLLTAGGILSGIPGFATSVLGLLLILPPTRALIRAGLANRLQKMVEDLGVRSFEATSAYRPHAEYGSFGGFGTPTGSGRPDGETPGQTPQEPIVIDEDEIKQWTEDVRPEDFGRGEDGDRK